MLLCQHPNNYVGLQKLSINRPIIYVLNRINFPYTFTETTYYLNKLPPLLNSSELTFLSNSNQTKESHQLNHFTL